MNYITIDIPNNESKPEKSSYLQRLSLGVLTVSTLVFLIGATGVFSTIPLTYCLSSIVTGSISAIIYILSQKRENNNKMFSGTFFNTTSQRGVLSWLLAISTMTFYTLLYFFPETLSHIIISTDPISQLLRDKPADRWFLYGTLYSLGVVILGIRFIFRFKNSNYQKLRTLSVIFFQIVFSFFIPSLLELLNKPGFYFHYFWPLKPDYLFPSTLKGLLHSQESFVAFMGWWTIIIALIGVPVLTYFWGKRWYCSWVCGCGALAETVGDPFRHLSDKSLKAWKLERYSIYSILAIVTVGTVLLWSNSAYNGAVLQSASTSFTKWYGFAIGSIFSGVIGTGFYPIFGPRVWCRFGCPQAAILGILQKYFSRFRITTNGGQCISCGNCSTYCEMGIDVRAYAQRKENIVRASCVGCGICATVCPRGVLKLENGSRDNRTGQRM